MITGPDGEPVIRKWWNGYSALPDLTDPAALDWLRGELRHLRTSGSTGSSSTPAIFVTTGSTTGPGRATDPPDSARRGLAFAAEYAFNELRACWKMGGRPLAQRLHDKPCRWGAAGLGSLIPESIAQGLIGAVFNCPDMIGGGDVADVLEGESVDPELFVRFAQCSALFPMMQFSQAPWRVLDAEHLAAVTRRGRAPSVAAARDHDARPARRRHR